MSKKIDLSKYETKTGVDILPENWKEIAHGIFNEGGDWRNVVVAFDITKKQHEELLLEEEYKNVIDNGMLRSEAYWLDWGKANVDNKNANTPLFREMMSRMFKWDEKVLKAEEVKRGKQRQNKVEDYMKKWQTPVNGKQKKQKELAQ